MFEDRVSRGAALLARVRPGWERRISVDRLWISSSRDCVLGQVYGSFPAGARDLMRVPLPSGRPFSAAEHGFCPDSGWERDISYALTDAWRAEIRRRTGAGGA